MPRNNPPPEAEPREKGLPSDLNSEKMILGGLFLDAQKYAVAAAGLKPEDFHSERHQIIFRRMGDVFERGESIDVVTVYAELDRRGEVERIGGLTYLTALTDGIPQVQSLDAWVRLVKEKALLRDVIHNARHAINRAMAGQEAARDVISDTSDALLTLGTAHTGQEVSSALAVLSDYEGGINTFLDPSKQETGVMTGFIQFDEMTNGLHDGELVVVGARPSHGKSAWAMNVTERICLREKKPVVFFSLEVRKANVLRRMMCSLARVDQQKFRHGYVNAEERRRMSLALNRLTESPLFIDDSSELTVADIRAKSVRAQARHGKLALVVVDYLQLLGSRGRFENRNNEVAAQSRHLKLLAKELGCPVMVLSQLSRSVDTRKGDHRPQLSDLRDSGAIEADGDLITFIYRPERYDRSKEDLKGKGELIIAKQREGPVGTVKVVWVDGILRFENRAEDFDPSSDSTRTPAGDD